MKYGIAAMAISAVVIGGAVNIARAQAPLEEHLYVMHSNANGTCPALDWHIHAAATGQLWGIISWNDMKSVAYATGAMGQNRTFEMNATELGGAGRKATVTGQARADGWLVADINGQDVACKSVVIPIWRPSGGNG